MHGHIRLLKISWASLFLICVQSVDRRLRLVRSKSKRGCERCPGQCVLHLGCVCRTASSIVLLFGYQKAKSSDALEEDVYMHLLIFSGTLHRQERQDSFILRLDTVQSKAELHECLTHLPRDFLNAFDPKCDAAADGVVGRRLGSWAEGAIFQQGIDASDGVAQWVSSQLFWLLHNGLQFLTCARRKYVVRLSCL